MKNGMKIAAAVLAGSMMTMTLTGCGQNDGSHKTEIEIMQYKPEATAYFEEVAEKFNATHDDIHLTINSPNDASTIMRTRFIREDYPDIIGIGGDINYSYYVDAGILADISDYEGLGDVKQAYLDIAEELKLIPKEGTYIFRMWLMQQEYCITKIFLNSTGGKFQTHGMS